MNDNHFQFHIKYVLPFLFAELLTHKTRVLAYNFFWRLCSAADLEKPLQKVKFEYILKLFNHKLKLAKFLTK